MSLRPEQQRALAYLHKRGTKAPAAKIHQEVKQALEEFEALIVSLDGEAARRRPEQGRWSVQEIVDHLVESLRPGLEQFRSLMAGQSPPGGAVPLSLLSPDPLSRPWDEVRDELHQLHRQFLALLAGATDDLPLEATAPVHMLIKAEAEDGSTEALDWVERFDWKAFAMVLKVHTVEHYGQALGALATLYPCRAPVPPSGPPPK